MKCSTLSDQPLTSPSPFLPTLLQALQAELQVVKTAASRAMGQLEDSAMMAGGGAATRGGRAADKTRVEFKQVMSTDGAPVSPLMMARASPGSGSSRLLRQVRALLLLVRTFTSGASTPVPA